MKNLLKKVIPFFSFFTIMLPAIRSGAQTYTSVYNGVTYTSNQPYNLNVIYFVPNDVPLDTSYKRRISENLLWGQNFFRQNMIANGYGPKTFGMFKEATNPDRIKIIKIDGTQPSSAYPYNNANQMRAEVDAYFNANPSQKTSEHFLIIGAAKNLETLNLPFYGTGKYCYAIDFPKWDIMYMNDTGTDGANFGGWFGGMLHELGHGLNVGHSHQTSSENFNPAQGMNLMFYGNGSLSAHEPTFINRADCSVLNTSQTFANAPATYYNGHSARITALHASYSNGNIVVSGKYTSNVPVTDIGIYQDPYATPSAGYYRVAWSVSPIGTDSFYATMAVSDINGMAGVTPTAYDLQNYIEYNLQVVLMLKNGEIEFSYFPFSYTNNIPNINVDFDDLRCDALCCGWAETNVGIRDFGPTPGYICYKAANNNNIRVKTFSTLWGTSDAFPFGYTTLTGDGSIIARVKNLSTNWNDYGGIMMRNSLNSNDKYVSTGLLDTRGIYDQNRYSANAPTGANGQAGGGLAAATLPVWVKLQRKGNTISSFYSQDGTIWRPHNNYSTTMGSTVYAGVFASNPTAQADIDFPAVLPCTLPSGWAVADIGTVSAPGTACNTAGTIHMESYGTGFVTGPTDQVTFMYKPVAGNVNIVARIKNVSNGFNTLGGLMIRNTLDANSSFITSGALDTRGIFNTFRTATGVNSGYNALVSWNWPSYAWVKLSRTGNTVTCYTSVDGSNWMPSGTYTIALANSIYVGLVSAGMGQASNIDQVWINGVLQAQKGIAEVEPAKPETTLHITPNPASSVIDIALHGSGQMKGLNIYDMAGRKVLQQTGAIESLNIATLPAGAYIVEVQLDNNETLRERVIKQ